MKYGSVNNLFSAAPSAKPTVPAVGDGATFFYWTDRGAGTVTRVETSKAGVPTVYVKGDKVTWNPWPDGYAASYAPGDGPEIPIKLRKYKSGWRWVTAGPSKTVVRFGYRDAYHDPHF